MDNLPQEKKIGIGKAIHGHMVVKLGLGEKEKEDREGRSIDEWGLQLSDQCLVRQCQGSKYVAKIRRTSLPSALLYSSTRSNRT